MTAILQPGLVGVVAATLVSFVIGAIWYAPPVFGKTWMAALGKTDEWWKANRNKSVVFGFLVNLLTAYLLGVFVKTMGSAGAVDGITVSLFAWLGFVASVHFTTFVFEGRPTKLFALDVVHSAIIFVVMGAILGMYA